MADTDPIQRLNAALERRYRIERELGAGGMATVYLAEDVRHHRNVALKVLKPELAAIVGADRFLTEIETTANLQHPHILPLFDSGEADGFLFYVMPYVEGESLRERLDREHQLPVDDAIRIASDVAEALAYAHEHGVIHRDIKPANILIHSGRPVLSDFGIALAIGAAGGGRLTETGLSLGTPHYMSPEQATGDTHVGPASDIYALGCVLHEMLVGEPPYTGSTPHAVLGKIITEPPAPVRRHRKTVPANLEAVIACALEKVPADRFRTAEAFASAMSDPAFDHRTSEEARRASPGARRIGPVGWMTALVLVSGLGIAGWLRPQEKSILRYAIPVPEGARAGVFRDGADISPDGSWLVRPTVEGDRSLYLRSLEEFAGRALPGTDSARMARVSPDGSRIAFSAGRSVETLKLVPRDGGSAITLADHVHGIAWIDDETLAFTSGTNREIHLVSDGGGPSDEIWTVPDEAENIITNGPNPVAGRRALLFTLWCPGSYCDRPSGIWALDIESGQAHPVTEGILAVHARGRLMIVRSNGSLVVAPFDAESLRISGDEMVVQQGIATDGTGATLRIADDGTMLVGLGPATSDPTGRFEPVWIGRNGSTSVVDPRWSVGLSTVLGSLRLSPDGTRLAYGALTESGEDIWIKELPRGPLIKLTQSVGIDSRPAWTHDGRVAYRAAQEDSDDLVLTRRADGSGAAAQFLVPSRVPYEIDLSRDGRWAVLRVGGSSSQQNMRDLVAYALDGEREEIPLLDGEFDEAFPRLSPDGRWLAYNSNESGRFEVYVRPFPDVEAARVAVSSNGGTSPIWTDDGREIIYLEPREGGGHTVASARIALDDDPRVLSRERLFEADFFLPPLPALAQWFDVTPDGTRLIALRAAEDRPSTEGNPPGDYRLGVVVGFFEAMREGRN